MAGVITSIMVKHIDVKNATRIFQRIGISMEIPKHLQELSDIFKKEVEKTPLSCETCSFLIRMGMPREDINYEHSLHYKEEVLP